MPVRAATIQQQRAAEKYIGEAQRAGCPPDQIKNFLRGGVVLQPKQLEASAAARLCDQPGGPNKVGFGGSRGGGKSHWMLAQMVADDCQRYPGLKCLMLRKVGKALKENFADLLRKALAGVPYSYVPSRNILEMPNGSQVILGHFQRESDIDAYLGLEYDVIGVEEATTLTQSKHRAIETCNRTSKTGWRPRMYDTTNPGNLGHAWFKALYIAPYKAGQETATRFIPSTVDDNAFINADYEKVLGTLTGWQLRAWRYGDWDIAAGQFFTNFRADLHVIKPVELARNWTYWCALDYGFTHYTVVYLMAKDTDGNVFVVDEHAERQWLPQRHVPAIQAMLARHGLSVPRLSKLVAGADVFAVKGDGQTIADKYKSLGIVLECANNDRINGAGEILIRLGDDAAKDLKGRPRPIPARVFIFERCAGLIGCLPSLQHDPHRPEDVLKVDCDEDGNGGDDHYDAFRYGVMDDWRAPLQRQHTPVAPGIALGTFGGRQQR